MGASGSVVPQVYKCVDGAMKMLGVAMRSVDSCWNSKCEMVAMVVDGFLAVSSMR